jgi:hypothetical protein
MATMLPIDTSSDKALLAINIDLNAPDDFGHTAPQQLFTPAPPWRDSCLKESILAARLEPLQPPFPLPS